ncbi:MAG: 50S ribosomal protein L25 [Blastocatellia bacterium]
MSFDSTVSLDAKSREERGKNAARRLRAAGLVPITVYGGDLEAASTTIVKREFAALMRAHGRNMIFTLNIEGAGTPVKIAEMQLDPIRGTLLHADLMRISLTEKSKFEVPVHAVGEAEGVKMFNGILDVVAHSVEVRCLPTVLPSVIEADISAMQIGDHLRVKDLKVADDIEILDDPEKVIFTVIAPRVEETVEPAVAEPEVIKKGKPEEK